MKSRPKKSPHQAAFEEIYERHSREVWALVYARWLNADVALDIMQETFLRLWKQFEEGSDIVNPRAWVLRVARNLAEDHAKSAFRRYGTQPPQTMNGVEGRDSLPLDGMAREETFGQTAKRAGAACPPRIEKYLPCAMRWNTTPTRLRKSWKSIPPPCTCV